MSFNRWNFGLLLIAIFAVTFSSCRRDDLQDMNHVQEKCFEIVYPVTVAFPDSTFVEVADEAEMKAVMVAWIEANPEAEKKPSIAFPYDMTKGRVTVSVENERQERRIKEACNESDERADKKCYYLIYPVTINFPDGTSEEVADEEAHKATLKAWKEANPEAEGRPSIAFPYDVKKNGNIIIIENEELQERLRKGCRGDRDEQAEPCFEVIYPATLVFPDGTRRRVRSARGQQDAIQRWQRANPRARRQPQLAFPYKVKFGDRVVEVTGENVLERLSRACEERDEDNNAPCFKIIYPVTINFPDSTTAMANNAREHRALIGRWVEANPDVRERPMLAFPYKVQFGDRMIEVTGEDILERLRRACEDDDNDRDEGAPCLEIVYPVTINFPDSTTVMANDAREHRALIGGWVEANPDVRERPTLAFPYDVKLRGEQRTVENAQMAERLRRACADSDGGGR